MFNKKFLLTLLLGVSLYGKDIYLNKNVVLDSDNYFKNISLEEISNKHWMEKNFMDILQKNYYKCEKPFRNLVSFEEYKINELEKIRHNYILLNSTGLNKNEFVKLYLDVLNLDLKNVLSIKDNLDKPVKYNNMIEFINNKSNNYEEILHYDNSLKSIREMILNYKFYNYAGKINVNNKINDIIKNLNDNDKFIALSLTKDIKPNINEFTDLELILSFYRIYSENGQNLNEIKFKDPLVELSVKLEFNLLKKSEYIDLKKQILLTHYSKYYLESDYIENLFKEVEQN